MIESLKKLEEDAKNELTLLSDPKGLEGLKVKYLGRKGLFASVSAQIAELPDGEKRLAGQEMNRVKQALETLFSDKESVLQSGSASLGSRVDVTMPGTFAEAGSLHPLTQVVMETAEIFRRLGFSVVEDGNEVETEWCNFEALNISLDHPARDSFDTFYLDKAPSPKEGKWLLRSQTSTVQIRQMKLLKKPPVRIIAPGKVYRPDATDATHSFMFHQIEGLLVDQDVTFSDLKGVLYAWARAFFGPAAKLRFRPHFFPFTEPSAEIDLWWEGKGWLEILGAGLVHPNVLRAVNFDPEKVSGFAFGMGVERIAMLKYGVQDIRDFFENDIRFLRQF